MEKITNINVNTNLAEKLEENDRMTKAAYLNKMKVMFSTTKGNKEAKKSSMNLIRNANETGFDVYAEVGLDDLSVDMSYQREHGNRVRKIASEWDNKKCSPLIINIRPTGEKFIIDGFTHFEAAKIRDIDSLPARVLCGLSVEEEAEIFASQGDGVKKPNPYDIYKANLVWGELIDTEIERLCNKYELKIKPAEGLNDSIRIVTCLTYLRNTMTKKNGKEKLLNTKGRDAIDKTFMLLRESGMEDYDKAYCHAIVSSISGILMDDIYEKYDAYEIIKANLSNVDPSLLVSYAVVKYPMQSEAKALKSLLTDFVVGSDSINLLRGRVKELF